MARLVVRRIATLLFRHNHALALRAHQDFVFGFFEVDHLDHAGVAACGHQGSFVTQVRQISTTHSRCTAGDDGRSHVLSDRHFTHMHIQNLLTAANVWQGDIDLAVETARTQ